MHKRIQYLFFLFVLSDFTCNAQIDAYIRQQQKEFEQFKRSREQEFQKFKNRNDSLFYAFLNKPWKEYEFFYNEREKVPKPIKQPEFSNEEILNHKGKELFPAIIVPKEIISEPEEKGVDVFKIYHRLFNRHERTPVHISYYGNEDTLYIKSEQIDINDKLTKENIKKFYRYAESSEGMDEIISQLNTFKMKYNLNDWAFIQITKVASKQAFSDSNTQILFVWYVLMHSGFKAKTAYSGNDIFLLVTSSQEIRNANTISVDGENFYEIYSIGKMKKGKIFLHDGDYPGTKKISMQIHELPDLKNKKLVHELGFEGKQFFIDLNNTLVDFFNDYPPCDLEVYFNAPLSNYAKNSLDKILEPILQGKSDKEKIAILLKFLKESFPYKLDEEQFNEEKYMFPDEVLKYPYSDCEDRAVLFARLVKLYTNLKPLGLNYPGHVSVAVNLKDIPNPHFFKYNGENFIICDPTFMNGGIGMSHPKYVDNKPEFIYIE